MPLRINFRGKQGDLVTLVSYPIPGSPGCDPRTGPGDTFDSSTCQSFSPVIGQAGWGIAHTPPSINGGTVLTRIGCEEDVRAYVPGVGDEVWFLNPRGASAATAAYGD